MNKVLSKLFAIALLAVLLSPTSSKASHLVAGDITYAYTGTPNTFLITLRLYRDCSGITMSTQETVCYTSASCGVNQSLTLTLVAGSGNQIPPSPCVPIPPGGTTCNGGTGYGVQEYKYQAVVVMPQQCFDYLWQYENCCRNTAITTLNGAGGQGFYLEARMDNLNYPMNSSPFFSAIPVTQFCVNNQFYFDQGAFDVDGDSLGYVLINAQDATGNCPKVPFDLGYVSPYSGLNPVQTANGTTIDQFTGLISFLPTLQQTGVIVVRCYEYDRATGNIKSIIKREMQINIVATCILSTPSFDSTLIASGGLSIVVDGVVNAACDDSVFYITVFPPIQCGSIVPSDIRFVDPFGVSNPVASAIGVNCVNGLTDSIRVTLINPISIGTSYIYTKIGNDGNTFLSECGSPMAEFDTLRITLYDSTVFNFSIADTLDCAFDSIHVTCNQFIDCYTLAGDGTDFLLFDANGVNIPILGVTCLGVAPGHFNNEFALSTASTLNAVGPLVLIVQNGSDLNTINNSCGSSILANDTIGFIQVRNNLSVNAGSDITACNTDPTPQINAGSFFSGAVYTWTFNGTNTGDSTQVITAGNSGQYIVTVSASPSCFGIDTVDVNILQAPVVSLGNDYQLCTGDPFPTLDAGNTGANYQWFLNGTAISAATNQQYTPTAAGTYSVTVNVGATCLGRDTIEITVNPGLIITLPSDQTLCSNEPLPTLDAGAISGATYQWTVNGVSNPADTLQTINVSGAGTYEVIVTNANGCTGTDSYTLLNVIPVPAVDLGSDLTLCATDPLPTLDAGSGAQSYQWYENGVAISGATNSTFTVVNANGGTYSVIANNGNNCTGTDTIVVNIVQQLNVALSDLSYCSGPAQTLQANTSNSGVSFSWTLNGQPISGQTGSSVPVTGSGTYEVTISTGTCSTSATATVTEVEQPTAALSNVSQCDVLANPVLNPGYTPSPGFNTVFAWTLDNNAVGGNTATFTTTVAGTYAVTITNTVNGFTCVASASMTLTLNASPAANLGNDINQCQGDLPATLTTSSGANNTFAWTLNNNTISGAADSTLTAGVAGNYAVIVTSPNGCTNTDNVVVSINNLPVPVIQDAKQVQDNVLFCLTQNPAPQLSLLNPVSNYTYDWSLDGNSFSSSPSVTVTAIGQYSVLVTDSNGCKNTDVINVIEAPCEIEIYNVITPNNDGKNDVFEVKNLLDFPVRKLTVYNRWGKEVYSADTYNNDWNGGNLAAGVYYFVLEYNNGIEGKTKKGSFNIIR